MVTGAQIMNFILVVMNFRIPQQQGTEQVGSSGKAFITEVFISSLQRNTECSGLLWWFFLWVKQRM